MTASNEKATGALSRFKILDLTRVRAGPTCVRQFADWGADVLKIESPEPMQVSDGWGGLRGGPDFQNLHRNKKSLTLNLKSDEGLAIFNKLAAEADVVVENFRPEVKFRLGIDYETLKKINSRLVYASISGFGQDGPYAKRPGFDHVIQGMAGLMAVTGFPETGPVRTGIAVSDIGAGLFGALAIMTALLEREASGQGQWVQVSLLQSMISMLDFQAARWLISGEIPGQAGNDHPTSIPTGVYPTTDGLITIAAGEQNMWARLCDALEAPELFKDDRFKTEELRSLNRTDVNAGISNLTKSRSNKEWLDRFERYSVAAGPINKMNEVFEDPQVRHMRVARTVSHPGRGTIQVVGQPFELSRTASELRTAAPERGEHTIKVLSEMGYSLTEIDRLAEQGVI